MDGSADVPTSQNSPTTNSGRLHSRQRRTIRVRIACLRCQRRKIRCDGAVPSCGGCLKAGTECIDGGKEQNSESPRAFISSLKDRVQWLESIIRTRCPDINLEGGAQDPSAVSAVHDRNASLLGAVEQTRRSTPPDHLHGLQETSMHYVELANHQRHETTREDDTDQQDQSSELRHEIGLVSLSGGRDLRYIGPSSGYSFAKLLLACATRRDKSITQPSKTRTDISDRFAFLLPEHTRSGPPAPLPPDMNYAIRLSEAYFETVHIHLPFLHQPSHESLIRKVYEQEEPNPVDAFQVNMVLAISATTLSRRLKLSLPGAGYCASAMQYFSKIYLENSLRGLQCLLLLLVYTVISPSTGLNVWYLNYQCIAALLDLGLQRDVKSGQGLSVLEQELRTRTFWVIYCLDRQVATMMGRPVGLRDEACDLRLPADVDDNNLSANNIQPRQHGHPPNHMSAAIHLFKLAQINSEIKYICHSVSHKTPSYSYPVIPNILQWQQGVLKRLAAWRQQIPQFAGEHNWRTKLCEMKYHGVLLLLLSASPAIPHPTNEALKSCYESAVAIIQLYNQFYKEDLPLSYCWMTVHSIFLSTMTMLHCIWTDPGIASQIQVNELVAIVNAGSNVLSATGEYWPEAKRSRDVLDGLSSHTVRWLLDRNSRNSEVESQLEDLRRDPVSPNLPSLHENGAIQSQNLDSSKNIFSTSHLTDTNLDCQFWGSLLGDITLTDNVDFNDPVTVNAIMQGMFTNDYHLGPDYQQDFPMNFS